MTNETGSVNGPQATYRPKPDGKTQPAAEAGWYLQRERERRGISLQAAGRSIGVHPVHLQAIEMGDLANLPERAVALRIIGDYARFLGFEAKPLVEHFEKCLDREQQQQATACSSARVIPFPLLARLRDMARTPAGLSASVATLALLFGGLVWGLWPSETPPATKKDKPAVVEAAPAVNADKHPLREVKSLARVEEEMLPDAAPAPAASAEADPIGALITRTITQADTQPETGAAKVQAPPLPAPPATQEKAPAPAKAELAKTGQRKPTAAASRGKAGKAIHPIRQVPDNGLALKAAEEIWVRLEDDHGATWYSGFLRPGEVLVLPEGRTLRLTAGDVHRLEWFANGQSMGRLGKRGQDFISEPLKRLYQQAAVPAASAG